MLLVDTSVWIDQALQRETSAGQFVFNRQQVEDVCVTGAIIQEVLQGARTDKDYGRLRDMLEGYVLLVPQDVATYELAANLYRRARAHGYTIRSANDCLIAALALEHGATLVHNDRDFFALAQVEPHLIIFPGRPH